MQKKLLIVGFPFWYGINQKSCLVILTDKCCGHLHPDERSSDDDDILSVAQSLDLIGVVRRTENENVFGIRTRNGQGSGSASRRDDQVVVLQGISGTEFHIFAFSIDADLWNLNKKSIFVCYLGKGRVNKRISLRSFIMKQIVYSFVLFLLAFLWNWFIAYSQVSFIIKQILINLPFCKVYIIEKVTLICHLKGIIEKVSLIA